MESGGIERLSALFKPFDLLHFLGLAVVLTVFVFLWGLIVTNGDGYASARRFWTVHLVVLGAGYAVSSIGFFLLHIDPLLLLLGLCCVAFIVQGNLSAADSSSPREDWRAFKFLQRLRETEEEQEP